MSDYGVYVHVPWCRSVCPYCAFNVRAARGAPFARYVDALLSQWESLRPVFPGRPSTLYLGGGTPSLVPAPELARLVEAIAPSWGVEMEANPEDVDPERLGQWRALGVRRLSLGVQTFSAKHARVLKRAHSVSQAREVLAQVGESGVESWSVDLIFGLPEQTPADFGEDLDALVASGAPHASLYSLTVEPGTPFERAVERGALSPADEEAWAEMFQLAAERLPAAGLARYEVSNFARPGHESRHNEHYWRGRPYAGLGAGAHGLLPGGQRSVGLSEPEAYMATPTRWESLEAPEPEARAIDLLLSTLRHRDGVPLPRLESLGYQLPESTLAPLSRAGLLRRDSDALRLTDKGWALESGVLRALAQGLKPSG